MIHPLLRRADSHLLARISSRGDSSPPANGRPELGNPFVSSERFIPSCEGQTLEAVGTSVTPAIHPLLRMADKPVYWFCPAITAIHPFLRRAGIRPYLSPVPGVDSSLPAKGRHSVFMRLSAALNTSLCNLHKCHSCLIHIFNMPKNPQYFHFFSNYFFFFSTPITRDIPAPYDLDRPTPFLIKFRNAFASLTRSRNSYPNTLTG